ncbi:D-amino acid aminotransferase [Denitratisoma sp. DHT3]|uniref:D-amino acid aminotransferase n=1 Tax=Denitratisoma sp. DHT3 TaxID=1981880 RepID=UPI00119871A2|nr:D-amino acid aminotransferase [Denitratisoma sp. DHT3]QDX82939.1 D-amino acid aminotransferase [Denitratisoma sp. DHT3]
MVYLNGEWLPPGEARISVMDRGFLFGDGVYEVIPVYSRRPFRLAEHLRRLDRSLAAVRIANPHGPEVWETLVREVVESAEWDDQSVYLQVTRGAAPVRNHAFPKAATPTVFLMTEPLPVPPAELRQTGVTAVSAADNRWHRCDIKAISLLANCLLRQEAVEAGCAETVLFRDGILTEGAAANIFAVKDGVLLAPQKNHLMLPGITYDVVLELAAATGLPHEVRDILETEVRGADELWLSSSTKEILPIVRLDDRPIGAGSPGPVYAAMYRSYQEFKQKVMRNGG